MYLFSTIFIKTKIVVTNKYETLGNIWHLKVDKKLEINVIKNLSFLIYFNFLIVVQLQLSPFSHPHLPPSILTRFSFVHGSFIHVLWWPFPFFPPLFLSFLPSGYCQFVLYFNVSGYILLACLYFLTVINFHFYLSSDHLSSY